MFWLILFGVLAILICNSYYKALKYWKDRGVPSVKPMPLIGNMGPFISGKLSLAETVQYFYYTHPDKRYVGINQFVKPTLIVTDVDLMKQIAIRDFDHFVDRRTFVAEEIDPLFAKSLFSLTGQRWKDMRSTLSPAFSGSKMRAMYILISESAEQFISHLMKNASPGKSVTYEMKDLFTRYANDVIATTAFGIKCDSLEERNNDFFVMGQRTNFDGFLMSMKFFGYTLSPALMKLLSIRLFPKDVCSFFSDIVTSTMKIREEKGIIRPDMIHLLMEAKKGRLKLDGIKQNEPESPEDNAKNSKPNWTDEDISSQALFFFFAGFETSSTLLCHMANELALNEDVQTRLQEEINATLENYGEKVTYEALMEMKYLDMVISETLRKWPPVPVIDRKCVKPYTIQPANSDEKPVHIQEDVFIWFPIFGIHRDPQYFPDPERFDPERFSEANKEQIKPFSNLPFGIGPRNCIAGRFAIMEAKTVYFYLLSKFNIRVVKETQIPLKLKRLQFSSHAEKGYWVGLELRK